MRSISRSEIHPMKMNNTADELVNCGYKIISNSFIYEYVGIGWIKLNEATKDDYLNIPQLVD